jgi:hypothetical protein
MKCGRENSFPGPVDNAGRSWTPRERVHVLLVMAAFTPTTGPRRPMLDTMRHHILTIDCQPDPLTPDWDWS